MTYSNLSVPRFSGYALVLFGSILFSTKAVLVKMAFRDTEIDAVSLLALRMLFSLPFFMITAYVGGKKYKDRPLTKRQWIQIIGLGLMGYYVSSLLDFIGLKYISAGLERLILFLYPSFTVLINAVFFKEKISKHQYLALSLCYLGIIFTFINEIHLKHQPEHLLLGSGLIFLCAITFAGYIAGSGRLLRHIPSARFTSIAMLSATVGVFTHFVISTQGFHINMNPALYLYGLLLAIIATVIPNYIVSAGIQQIGASDAAILSAIGPVSTILLAFLFLGEKITPTQMIGTILVIGGVLLISRKSMKVKKNL